MCLRMLVHMRLFSHELLHMTGHQWHTEVVCLYPHLQPSRGGRYSFLSSHSPTTFASLLRWQTHVKCMQVQGTGSGTTRYYTHNLAQVQSLSWYNSWVTARHNLACCPGLETLELLAMWFKGWQCLSFAITITQWTQSLVLTECSNNMTIKTKEGQYDCCWHSGPLDGCPQNQG